MKWKKVLAATAALGAVGATGAGAALATAPSPTGLHESLSTGRAPAPRPIVSTGKVGANAVAPTKGYVFLTFDDGPSGGPTGYTSQVLQALKDGGAVATFFETGDPASNSDPTYKQYADTGMGSKTMDNGPLVRTALANGNQIGTHTWSHANLCDNGTGAGSSKCDATYTPLTCKASGTTYTGTAIDEVQKARDFQISLTGYDSKLFRYPYLNDSTCVTKFLTSQGMTASMPDVDSHDYDSTAVTGKPMLDDAGVVNRVMNGNAADGPCTTANTDGCGVLNFPSVNPVILMHDGTDTVNSRKAPTYLPLLIKALTDAGYGFGLLGSPPPGADKIPPSITMTQPPASPIAQKADFTVVYSCTDDRLAKPTCNGTVNGAPVASGAKLDTSSLGDKVLTVTAVDPWGNTTTQSATYKVTDQVNPTIQVDQPTARHYAQGEQLAAVYWCRDENPGVTCTSNAINGLVDTSVPGGKTFRVDAVDAAGNKASAAIDYVVDAPPPPPQPPAPPAPQPPAPQPPAPQPPAPAPPAPPAPKPPAPPAPPAPPLTVPNISSLTRSPGWLTRTHKMQIGFRTDKAARIWLSWKQKYTDRYGHRSWVWRRFERRGIVGNAGNYTITVRIDSPNLLPVRSGTLYAIYVQGENAKGKGPMSKIYMRLG